MNALAQAVSDHVTSVPGHGAMARGIHENPWIKWPDAVLGRLVEALAAVLVSAEIIVLLTGVVARFVFHAPLVWSDEVASILFLWLAMLGAVVALRRGEHMRMTALAGERTVVEAVAIAASLAFLAMVAWPSWEYAVDEA